MATGDAQDSDEGGFLSRWSRRKGQVRQGVAVAEPPVPPVLPVLPLLPLLPPAVAVAAVAVAARAVAPGGGLAAPAPGWPAAARAPGVPVAQAAAPAEPAPADLAPADRVPPAALQPPPTLADVAGLTAESDYARFVAPGVDRGVKNAALKKLFTNPHFNIMDGLDTYIDDYGKPDPLPAGMLRQMAQSHALGLFADDPPPPLSPLPPPPLPAQAADPPVRLADPPDPPALVADPAAMPPADALRELPETLSPPKPNPDEDAALRLQPHDAAGPAGPGPGAGPHAGRPH